MPQPTGAEGAEGAEGVDRVAEPAPGANGERSDGNDGKKESNDDGGVTIGAKPFRLWTPEKLAVRQPNCGLKLNSQSGRTNLLRAIRRPCRSGR